MRKMCTILPSVERKQKKQSPFSRYSNNCIVWSFNEQIDFDLRQIDCMFVLAWFWLLLISRLIVIAITVITGIVFWWWPKLVRFLARTFVSARCRFAALLSFRRFLHRCSNRHRFRCSGDQRWCRIIMAIHHILHGME